MRLLHLRDANGGLGVPARPSQTVAAGNCEPHGAQPVPLWHPATGGRSHRVRCQSNGRHLMSASVGVTRRNMFKLVGGGIVVLVGSRPLTTHAQDARRIYPEDFNAYLVIGESGRVTVFSGKIEMGQGVLTSQAQMVAEELGVALASIDMVLGDTDQCPWDMGTFGSLTTRMFGPALRAAAAQARQALMTLAAQKLGVAADRVSIEHGVASVAGEPSRRVTFAELADGAGIAESVSQVAVLRSVADFAVMGKSPKRLDGIEKVTGSAKYAADIRLAGMLYARILRPPVHGAVLIQADTTAAEKLPGVNIVRLDDLIAVVHANPEAAAAALAQIHADWRQPEAALDQDTIFQHLRSHAGAAKQVAAKGDLAAAPVAKAFESIFEKGYVAHAPIEPHAAVADVRADGATVWASTQTPFPTSDGIAAALK